MRQSRLKWLLILPSVIAFAVIVMIPAVLGIYYSFTEWNGIDGSAVFIGIRNYVKILTDDTTFRDAFIFTAVFAAVTVVAVNVAGFFMALLVTREFRGRNIFRSIFFMPNLIGGILLGFTWQFIFTSIFSAMSKAFNMPFLDGWLSNQQTGFWGMVIVVLWQMSGYMMVIYIAQLQSIPDSVIEAAQIDGAAGFKRLTSIIVPLMWPAFTIGLFLVLSNSFKLFDQNLTLTGGAPDGRTQMIALNIYRTAFGVNKLGEAQAKAVIFLIAVAAITMTQLYITKKKEVEM